jgi:hypothetical protein
VGNRATKKTTVGVGYYAWVADRGMQPRPEFALIGEQAVAEYTVSLSEDIVADCTVASVDGRPALTELRLRAAYDGQRQGVITARLLKNIRIGELLAPAREELAEFARDPLWEEAASLWDFLHKQPRPGRAGHPDKLYASVASMYAYALDQGSHHPVVDVAERMRLSRARVRDLLHEARRRGLLTSPPQGHAGGELTARADEILK